MPSDALRERVRAAVAVAWLSGGIIGWGAALGGPYWIGAGAGAVLMLLAMRLSDEAAPISKEQSNDR